jgi:predicted nucleic acid-binding protein
VRRFSVDTNILIYAFDPADREKQARCQVLVDRLVELDTVLTLQVLGEFLNAARRRGVPAAKAEKAVGDWSTVFSLAATRPEMLLQANTRADRYQIQYWDSLIVGVCLAHGVTMMFSEDLQHGMKFDGLTVINPLEPESEVALAEILYDTAS